MSIVQSWKLKTNDDRTFINGFKPVHVEASFASSMEQASYCAVMEK